MRNDSAFNASGEDIFTSQNKEYYYQKEYKLVALFKNQKMLGSHTFVYPKLMNLILQLNNIVTETPASTRLV